MSNVLGCYLLFCCVKQRTDTAEPNQQHRIQSEMETHEISYSRADKRAIRWLTLLLISICECFAYFLPSCASYTFSNNFENFFFIFRCRLWFVFVLHWLALFNIIGVGWCFGSKCRGFFFNLNFVCFGGIFELSVLLDDWIIFAQFEIINLIPYLAGLRLEVFLLKLLITCSKWM